MSSLLFNKDALIDLAAGWCSGAAAVICCQPIDTILTRNQAGARLVIGSLSPRTLVADAGITKLWRGALPMIGAVPLQNALLMAGYGLGKRSETNWGVFVGGCTGGVIQSFLMSPVELLKVQLQVDLQVGAAAAAAAAAHQSQRSHVSTTVAPIRQFIGSTVSSPLLAWKGLGATLLRDGIPHGVWFVSYEVAKDYLGSLLLVSNDKNGDVENDGGYHKSLTVPLLSGAFAATAAWGVGYPADLIKTRIQAGSTKGIIGTAQELLLEPGGLYRGFGLKLLRSVPASMIGFVVYEQVAQSLGAGTALDPANE